MRFSTRSWFRRCPRPAAPRKGERKRKAFRALFAVEELEPRILMDQGGASSIFLLDPSGRDSLSATGNGKIAVTGSGSITVDSSSAEAALAAGNGQVSAATLFVRGEVKAAGNGTLPGTI